MGKSKKNKKSGDEESQTNRKNTTITTTRRSRPKFNLDHYQLCFIGQMFCGVVLILSLELFKPNKNSDYYEYALAVAIVALILSFVGLLLYSINKDQYYGRYVYTSITVGYIITVFLALWWFVGASLLTFNQPFQSPGNAYFALWGGVMFSIGVVGDGVTTQSSLSATMGMMLCSIVLLAATPSYVGEQKNSNRPKQYHDEALYAMIVAICTIIIVSIKMYFQQPQSPNVTVILFTVLAIVWMIVPFLTTFRGPFLETGNGYFASWIGAITSFIAAMGAYHAMDSD